MSFPLTLAGRTFDSGPDLARAVMDDAIAGGGTVVDGHRPAAWLARAVREGELPRALAVGLSAALVQSGRTAGIVEVATLAADLGLTELASLLPAALDGLDVGVLLTPDPRQPDRSVEDALLDAWAAIATAEDAASRDALLGRLRHAGLRGLELRVLARTGDPETVRQVLPPILVEELPVGDVATLAEALVRGPEVASAVCEAATPLNSAQRYAIWRAAAALDPKLEADDDLRARWLAPESPDTTETTAAPTPES